MTAPARRARIASLLAVPVAVAGAAGILRADRAPVYALVGGRVVTGVGAPIDHGTVLIRDGLIEAVGASVKVPADARVIEVAGQTVTAGIVDGFGSAGLPAAPAGRGTGAGGGGASPAPAPGGLAADVLVLQRVRAADVTKARDEGITTALSVPRDGVVPGRSVLLNLTGESPDAMVLKQPAALHLQMTSLARVYPGSLMGTMAYARQALADARHYKEEWDAYRAGPRGRKRPRYDASLEAWQDVLGGRLPLVVTAPRENDIRRALALADEFRVTVIAAGGQQAFRVADLVKSRRLPLLVSVNYDPPLPAAGGFGGGPDEEKQRRDIEDAERNPAALHRAGVTFALVSGHAPDFLAGVRKAVERGLPSDVALQAITLRPAEVLGVADRLGTLEAGKIANVVVWPGDPLAKGARPPRMVFVDGRLTEPEEKERPAPSPSPSPRPGPVAGGAR